MPKRPSFQFYPGDWLRSSDLRSCSVGARGLWIDMLCLMHEGSPYGCLKVGSKVILPANLSRMVGATLPETEGWLEELREAGVYSVDDQGAIYSRRMQKDEKVRAARAAGGKKGGNPALLAVQKVNLDANLEPTPSSASSSPSPSSSSSSTPKEGESADGAAASAEACAEVEVLGDLLTAAERRRLEGLMKASPVAPSTKKAAKLTDESGMREERLYLLDHLWRRTSGDAGDGDTAFELYRNWRAKARAKSAHGGSANVESDVRALRALLEVRTKSGREILNAMIEASVPGWRKFDWSYLEEEKKRNGRARSDRDLAPLAAIPLKLGDPGYHQDAFRRTGTR